jgi:predicted DNA-binding transcriptional regulator AlpA
VSPTSDYLTRRDLRQYLNASYEAIASWVKSGGLPAPRRLGPSPRGRLVWTRAEVDHHIAALPPVDLAYAN